MKSNNDSRSSSTLSAAPSITASKTSFKQSKFSLNSGYSHSLHSVRSVGSHASSSSSLHETHASTSILGKDSRVDDLLDKVKFYTSLCLGKLYFIYLYIMNFFIFFFPFLL